MKKLLIVFTVLIASCKPPVKPYIITAKFPKSYTCAEGYCKYYYTSQDGQDGSFCDYEEKYNVGDSIQ